MPNVGTTSQGKYDKDTKTAFLSLPYIDETFSAHVNHYIKTQNLPITVVYRPGTTLHKLFCSSRPYDTPRCTLTNCEICPLLENLDCSVRCVVYVVKCEICQDIYVGETYRSCHDRFSDHLRAAKKPDTYPDNAIGKHYGEDHPGLTPLISFKILQTKLNSTLKRKVVEALFIRELKPALNNKLEGNSIEFLVRFSLGVLQSFEDNSLQLFNGVFQVDIISARLSSIIGVRAKLGPRASTSTSSGPALRLPLLFIRELKPALNNKLEGNTDDAVERRKFPLLLILLYPESQFVHIITTELYHHETHIKLGN
eukprot:sb/3467080/